MLPKSLPLETMAWRKTHRYFIEKLTKPPDWDETMSEALSTRDIFHAGIACLDSSSCQYLATSLKISDSVIMPTRLSFSSTTGKPLTL